MLAARDNSAILPAAETMRATGKGDSVARPRWQAGFLRKRGKKNPVWAGCYREDAIAENGTRIRRQRTVILGPVREISKRQAQQLLSARLAAINQGRQKPELMIEFEAFVRERFEPLIYPTLRFSTRRNYTWYISRHLLPTFRAMRLSEIGAADVQLFIAQKCRQVAPKTVVCLKNLLSKIFNTAVRWGCLNSNPAQGAQVPALVDTKERLALTPQQVRALLAELAEPYRTMVLLAILSGLRRGEIFGLRWRYVDFAECSLRVAECSYQGQNAPPKTRASRRKVFLDRQVLDALARLRPELHQPDDFVFHSDRGEPLNADHVRKYELDRACDRAKIPRVGWHTFRRSYATWADPSGESIKALQTQLGHTDSRLTLSVYTQPLPKAQRKLARKIARVLLPIAAKSGDRPNRKAVVIQ